MRMLRDAETFALVGALVAMILELVVSSSVGLSPTLMVIFMVSTAMRHSMLFVAGLMGCLTVLSIRRTDATTFRFAAVSGVFFGALGYAAVSIPVLALEAMPTFFLLFSLPVILTLLSVVLSVERLPTRSDS